MAELLTQQEIYDIFVLELQNQSALLTDDSEGSIVDVLAGVTSVVVSEIMRLTVDEYAKTFFDSANGPEVTGGPDDLETLAVDHFGPTFARPAATKSTGEVTFSRPNDDEGEVTIPAGTELSTDANANGEKQRFVTTAEVTMGALALTVIAEVEAVAAGVAGNVQPAKIINLDSTLTDPTITVSNAASLAGGAAEENDAEYRETIRNKLQALKGAVLSAIEATAKAVPGVSFATAIEKMRTVIDFDIGTNDILSGATYFRMPYAFVYVADANGASSPALIATVQAAVDAVRAAGVKIEVLGAVAVELDWSAELTFNPSGPSFAELSVNPQRIIDTMSEYVRGFANGADFNRLAASAAMMAIWGPLGTDDLTDFVTITPVGDVSVADEEKLIPGTVEIV